MYLTNNEALNLKGICHTQKDIPSILKLFKCLPFKSELILASCSLGNADLE